MQLTPREKDKLLIAMAAEVARKRLSRGVKLNHPEAIALICDAVVEGARDGPLHARAFGLSKALLGEDMAFDFDMLIFKDANTETETPWHQDEAYWPAGMTDKRAITMWTALDEATKANGSMWYIRGSHEGALLDHRPAAEGAHILQTDSVTEDTRMWLYSFFLLAYKPLTDSQMRENIAFSRTETGKAINTALFESFNRMFDTIYYQLGQAVAQVLKGSDL